MYVQVKGYQTTLELRCRYIAGKTETSLPALFRMIFGEKYNWPYFIV